MQRTTIHKIEQGDRRITVDELVGFAAVFGELDPGELLVPVELVHDRRIHELWREAGSTVAAMRASARQLYDQMGEMHRLVQTSEGSAAHRRGVRKAVDDAARRFAGVTWEQMEQAEAHARPWPEYVDRAWTGLLRSVERWAKGGE